MLLHQVHEPPGTGEPHLELPLQHRGRSELRADHQLGRLFQEVVVVTDAVLTGALARRERQPLDRVLVDDLSLAADEVADRVGPPASVTHAPWMRTGFEMLEGANSMSP